MSESEVRPWTEQEDKFLSDHYPAHGAVYCAVELKRSGAAVRSRCRLLGVRQREMAMPYTADEDEFIKTNYGRRRAADLAETLGRSEVSVRQRARMLGLASKR